LATVRECRSAIARLGGRLASAEAGVRAKALDRTVSCRVTDLDLTFHGRLAGGELVDVTEAVTSEPAQIRLTMSSEDLVDLVDGRLAFAHAWASGRVKLDASIRDLLRLRSLMD
jgi:hypothetical protein